MSIVAKLPEELNPETFEIIYKNIRAGHDAFDRNPLGMGKYILCRLGILDKEKLDSRNLEPLDEITHQTREGDTLIVRRLSLERSKSIEDTFTYEFDLYKKNCGQEYKDKSEDWSKHFLNKTQLFTYQGAELLN